MVLMAPVPTQEPQTPPARSTLAGPLLIACLGTLLTIATLAPEIGGPGMTCDEPYHVAYGKQLVTALRNQGPGFFRPANILRNFDWRPGGPPIHPPLGNWLLGWTHHLFDPAPNDPLAVSIAGARFAPALAFGLMIFLVGWFTTRTEGPVAGSLAAAATLLVPRLFGHAHLAALDTFTALLFVAAAIAVAEAASPGRGLKGFALAGVVWGLCLLTRLHGLLLLPPVAVWLFWRLRLRALAPLAIWLVAGGVTLLAGWPWLWIDTVDHLKQYLGTATGRMPIHVFYAGQVWADHEVPRHYAIATFLVTLPLGTLLLGLLGIAARRHVRQSPPGFYLLLGAGAFMLAVFSWPRVPVYDGERLFLMVFPLWAVAAGIGGKWLVQRGACVVRNERVALAVVAGLVLVQGVGLIVCHPCYLSHYSLLVGGLPGAVRLGFEANYWGDAVTERLLSTVADEASGGLLLFGPNLAPFQAPMVALSSAALSSNKVASVAWDGGFPEAALGCRYAVFYRRQADMAGLPEEILQAKIIAEKRIMGTWVARTVELPSPIGEGELRYMVPRRGPPRQVTPIPPRLPLRSD